MSFTQYLAKRAKGLLTMQPELNTPPYSMFNTGGVECEVGEFLHGLARMVKPEHILETGTHWGISAAYMALALHENGKGRLTTIEVDGASSARARTLLETIGIAQRVEFIVGRAEEWQPGIVLYDMILLDTELHLRFADMVRFWPNLAPGGFLLIHDLHVHMAQGPYLRQGQGYYGALPTEVEGLMRAHGLQSLHFRTPRGLYLAQKAAPDFHSTEVLGAT